MRLKKRKQATVTEKRFGEYHEDDLAVSLRAKSATCGGGSEVLVISYIKEPSDHYVPQTTNGCNKNKQRKES